MNKSSRLRRVLIASANPLFRDGLQKVYIQKWSKALNWWGLHHPWTKQWRLWRSSSPIWSLLIMTILRLSQSEFLDRFVKRKSSIKVVLVSLNEAGQVVVYDRRQMTSEQAEEWFQDPWEEEKVFEEHIKRARKSHMKRNNLKHFFFVGILVVLLSVVVYIGFGSSEVATGCCGRSSRTH